MFKELKELELIKDYYKLRVQYLKQKLQVYESDKEDLEKSLLSQRDENQHLTEMLFTFE
jgi:hypothetical protein